MYPFLPSSRALNLLTYSAISALVRLTGMLSWLALFTSLPICVSRKLMASRVCRARSAWSQPSSSPIIWTMATNDNEATYLWSRDQLCTNHSSPGL